MAQGMGGFVSLTGTADGEPTRAGVPVSDIFTGVYAVVGVLAALEAVGVPAGPINTLDRVFADPQVIHRGMRLDLASAAAKDGSIPGVRTPIMIGGAPMASERPAPRRGEHTAEILREIGEKG